MPDIESVELVCSPMTKFMDECNHCVCNSYGTAAICTTLECDLFHPDGSIKLPSEILNNPLLRSGGLEEDKKICEPSKTFKSECNTCVCSDDGLRFACTRMACTYMKRVCEPMTTFKRDCNSCSCNEDGTQAVCTRMNCGFYHKDGSIKLPSEILNNPLLRSSAPKSQVCEPTKTFYQGCNTCHCSEDGTNYSCTQMLCEPQDNKVCTPRSTFYKECNMCHCNGDGTGALCTRMSCNLFHAEGSLKLPSEILNNPLLRTRRTLNKKVCEPMTRFIKGCNSCLCNKDGTAAACTFLDCNNIIKEDGSIKLPSEILNNPLLRMGESKKVCEPMARFTKDCNNCICNKDGTAAACTFLNCNNIFHEDGSIKLPSEILNNPLLRVHHQENSDNNEWGSKSQSKELFISLNFTKEMML